MKKDVFISYSTKDRPLAESLVNFLEGHGFSCFISSRDIPLGANMGTLYNRCIRRNKSNGNTFYREL